MSKMTEQWKGHLSQIRVKLLLVRGKETLHPHNSRHTRIRQLVTLSLEPVPRSSCSSSEEASRLCWWRMTGLTGPTVLLLVALCASSAQEDNVTLEVQYPQRSIAPARGSSVKLSCDAIYDVKLCGLLRVAWYSLTTRSAELTELTEPSKYFTTVNETDDSVRRRQVVTEIFNLTPKDDGQFQCTAECETGTTGMGHYISITVGG